MEIGFIDVLFILAIGVAFYFMIKQKSVRRAALRASQTAKVRRPTQAEIQEELQRKRQKKARQLRLRILSGALIVTGAGILLEVTGMLKFVTLGYAMSGTLIICGAGVLLLSSRK